MTTTTTDGEVIGSDPRLSKASGGNDRRRGRPEVRTQFSIRSGHQILRVCCQDDVASYVVRYVRRGDRIRLQGDVKVREWTARDGAPRFETCVYADGVELVRDEPS
jgi:single-stranded DNA-binding protein